MSDTWNSNGGNDQWSASAPLSSLSPSTAKRKWQYTKTYQGRVNTCSLSSLYTEAEAQAVIASYNHDYSALGFTYALVGATTTQASQQANGQKAITPMKLTFARTALIASIQATIDAANAKNADAQAKFDAAVVTATAVVDANAVSLAVNVGFKGDDAGVAAFKQSPSYKSAISSFQYWLGLPSAPPAKPNTKPAEKLIATLNLATDTNLEIEEGHPFLLHLQ